MGFTLFVPFLCSTLVAVSRGNFADNSVIYFHVGPYVTQLEVWSVAFQCSSKGLLLACVFHDWTSYRPQQQTFVMKYWMNMMLLCINTIQLFVRGGLE
jgi:hypothetical protein